MYIRGNKRLLSSALLISVVIGILSDICILFIRLTSHGSEAGPDMVDMKIWSTQNILSMIEVILTAAVFLHYCHKLNNYISLVPPEDRKQMGILQEEAFGIRVPSLDAGDIYKLLEIWGIILVGVQIGYQSTSILYRKFITLLYDAVNSGIIDNEAFISLYNDTHGFKYVGMLIALLLGIAITGIFLSDRILKVFSMLYAVLFIVSFALLNMGSLHILGQTVGIVWTSILYHAMETCGMILLVMYLRKRYPGI